MPVPGNRVLTVRCSYSAIATACNASGFGQTLLGGGGGEGAVSADSECTDSNQVRA